MPRVRNVAPGFFENEDLAETGPLGQLLFAGLWCWADREGRLVDRPKRIKAWVFPYYAADVDALLDALAARGFIQRYQVGGEAYLEITNFLKYQHPHPREQVSTLPGADEAGPESGPSNAYIYIAQDQGASKATPRRVQGNALAVSSPAGFRALGLSGSSGFRSGLSGSSDHDASASLSAPGRENAAGTDADEAELLVGLQSLPKWTTERQPGGDLAKLRLWRRVYPDRLTLAELCAMQSWLTSNPRRSANYLFVENWLKRPPHSETARAPNGRAAIQADDPTSGGWVTQPARS